MWFWLAIIALLCWSGSDLFSKIGCRDGRDKYNPLKMVIAVGVVMGIHAAYEIFVGGAVVTWHVMWTYLPVSLLYIGSMTLGYVGLRYIELSISSPICNSSGALVAVLCLITGTLDESITGAMRWMVIGAVALVCIGVVGLGIVESREDDELRKKAAGVLQLQIRKILAGAVSAGGLLPAGRGGHVRRFSRPAHAQ